MGNTSGNQRHKSAGLIAPSSPTKEVQSQAFVFDKNSDSNALLEANPVFTKNPSKPNVCYLAISLIFILCGLVLTFFTYIIIQIFFNVLYP